MKHIVEEEQTWRARLVEAGGSIFLLFSVFSFLLLFLPPDFASCNDECVLQLFNQCVMQLLRLFLV